MQVKKQQKVLMIVLRKEGINDCFEKEMLFKGFVILWMASPIQWTLVWVNSRSWWWTGRPGILQFMGCRQSDTTERLNWTDSCGSLPRGLSGKEPTFPSRRCEFDTWVGKIPWRRKWQPTPVFLPGKSHGQRSLAGYRPQGCKRVGHNLVTK